jgi:hypothetical protein
MDEEKKPMKRWYKWFVLIFFVSAIGVFIYQRVSWDTVSLELKNETLHVVYAKTFYQQYRGLGKRDMLAPYDGMLFVYAFAGRQTMVMRDMRFPIDIVWFNEGKVVDIAKNLPLEDLPEAQLTKYYPRTDATVVLELPAGWADEHGLQIGDILKVVQSQT